MLEFLGLEEEAMKVVLGCILIGLPCGAQLGALTGHAEPGNHQTSPGQIVLTVITVIMCIVGFLVGGLPGVILFFTFQWGTLIGAILQGLIVATAAFFVGKFTVLRLRRRKYMRNPIIKEAVAFCKQNGVVGVQCFPEGMCFFTELEHPDYCKNSVHQEKKETQAQEERYKADWTAPESWLAYDRSDNCVGVLKFSARSFPNVPDLPMFASALAKKLGGFGYAKHYHSVQYDSVTFSAGTKTTTHHITVLRDDCFVYSRAAYRKAKAAWKPLKTPKEEKAAPLPKPNTWE